MTRHTHDDGQVVSRTIDYDHVVHHDDEPGLLVVSGVPAQVRLASDEYWFQDSTGFELARLLDEHRPGPREIRTLAWSRANAAWRSTHSSESEPARASVQ